MALRTQYIENRDYSAQDALYIMNHYNIISFASLFNPTYIDNHLSNLPEGVEGNKYSGIEITNCLNDFAKLSVISFEYKDEKAKFITKLFNHEYNTQDVLTQDQVSFFSWPAAVLQATKEDVAKHFEELAQKNAASVQNEEKPTTPSESAENQDQEENAQPKQEEISTASDLESPKQEIENEEYNEYGYSMTDYTLVDDLDTNSDI